MDWWILRALIATYASVGNAVNPNDVGFDLWPILGQSNTLSGIGLDVTYLDPPDPRIRQYAGAGAYSGQIIAAVDPLFHQTGQAAGVGFAMTFAKEYLRTVPNNRSVLLVPCGRGSTGMLPYLGYTWDPSDTVTANNLYNMAVTQIHAALAARPNSRIAGFLWHQGEGDSGDTTAANAYAAKFDSLITGLRAEFGADLPFILGQMNPDRMAETAAAGTAPGYPIVNAAHIDTPRRQLRTGFVYGPVGKYNAENEKIHYNGAGQRILGRGYADALRLAAANILGSAPVPVASVQIVQAGATGATITWTRTPGRVTGYLVQINTGSGWTTLSRPLPLDAVATVTGLTVGATVQARVSTINEQGTSASVSAAALTLAPAPATVTGLTAGSATSAAIPLSWSAVSGATSYTIEKRLSPAGAWTQAGTVTGTSYTVTSLSASTAYDFRVFATNSVGAGPASTAVTATTAAPTPLLTDAGVAAFTAYGFRKLNSAYSGPLVKVRRSSDNTTQDISALSNGELNTGALLTFVGAGSGYVDTLYDQSGNARNMAQTTTANQPILVESGVLVTKNGRPGFKLAGTQWMQGEFAGLYAAGATTVLGVYTAPAAADGTMPLFSEASSTSGPQSRYVPAWWSGSGAPVLNITDDAGATVKQSVGAVVAKDSALHQLSIVDSGTSHSSWTDGAVSIAPSAYTRTGTLTLARHFIGGLVFGLALTPSSPFSGIVSELVTLPATLTTGQRQATESNQKGFFGTP